MAKQATKTIVKATEEDIKDIQRKIYSKRLDQMEKKYSITSQESYIPNKLSTGFLCLDFIMAGGIAGGKMYQFSGLEKGAKTTGAYHIVGQAVRKEIPIIEHWDVENAVSDVDYVKACSGFSTTEIYVGKNKRVRLYQEGILETFYNSTKNIMSSLPDKIYRQDAKQWFHVFDRDDVSRANMGDFGYKSYNKTMFTETGRYWCECPLPGMQGFIICDSYPALVVSRIDEDEEAKILPAMNARAFADNIKKVIGMMSSKGFSILGINQIRVNPMPAYGQNPEYEPGGNALAFYSSCRNQNRPRGVPPEMFEGVNGKGNKTKQFGQEPSVYGKGYDRYNYIDITNTKNRMGTPGLYVPMRVWFRDGRGQAHGYDVAYDTFNYLNMTGRIEGSPKRGIKINLPECKNLSLAKLDWYEFKLFVLAHTDPVLMKRAKEHFKSLKIIPDIRKGLFKEIRTKEAYQLLVEGNTKNVEDMEL